MAETVKITFTDTIGVPEKYSPKPASKYVPDWHKELESYIGKEKKPNGSGGTSATIKRCMPVFDAIAVGYIITSYVDIYVSQTDVFYADKSYYDKTGKTRSLSKVQIKKRNLKTKS